MSNSCAIENQFLINTSTSGLENLRKTALLLIRKHLYQNADVVNNPSTVNIQVTTPFLQERVVLPNELILEVEKIDLDRYTNQDNTGVKACYIPMDAKTYLVRNMWCIETIIHETLHSCSRFSKDILLMKYLNWYEGLTELLTGYILFKEFSECYNNCFRSIGHLCEITYTPYVKLWVGFCNFISLKNLISIYFPTEKTLENEVENLVKKVNALGFKKFGNPLSAGKLATDIKFKINCQNAFESEFTNIYKNRELWTDFSKVKDS